ncbi:MAG: transcription termination factor Rho [Tissierellia bacterium]|nr:transcription termination factor Rho [Tissierellia bacterium]
MEIEKYSFEDLKQMKLPELREIGKEKNIKSIMNFRKAELIEEILKIDEEEKNKTGEVIEGLPVVEEEEEVIETADSHESDKKKSQDDKEKLKNESLNAKYGSTLKSEGVLEVFFDGYGFLRADNYESSEKDTYVSPSQIRRFNLKQGDKLTGLAREAKQGERYKALLRIDSVNGIDPELVRQRPNFDSLTAIYPNKRLYLEMDKKSYATRMIDLVSPLGLGQRGIIVSPPKAGKTTLLKMIANSIEKKYPEIEIIVLLIDERPEEVTDMKRSINGDVVYSTFDEEPENHIKISEFVLERAKRLVESGKDVVLLLDSLTRLTRAYNLSIPSTGRTLSGGLDPGALYQPKRFFGAARNIEEGGSLTILATALVETGSRMDDVIFEEFKGTGNMEIHLDRSLQERRIFPAIDINKSGTRKEELLMSPNELEAVWSLRKGLSKQSSVDQTEALIEGLMRTENNAELVVKIKRGLL